MSTAAGEDILSWLDTAITAAQKKAEAAKAFGDGFAAGSEAPDCVYGTGPGGPYLRVAVPGFDGQTEAAVEHFALHGPESVLRRCAADRKLLELHEPKPFLGGTMPDPAECSECHNRALPCPTIVAVAEGYGWAGGDR